MNTFFPSAYNFMTECNKGIIIYNSLSGKILCIEDALLRDFEFLIGDEKIVVKEQSKLMQKLYEYKFICKSRKDEKKEVYSIYDTVVNSKEFFIEILPTEQCNFRCSYCYESYHRKGMDETCIDKVVEFVENNINGCTAMRVAWFGGEPMLELESIEKLSERFISLCKKNRIPYYASMTTNGYFLKSDIWSRLKKCRIFDYQISIDGLAEVHNKQRMLVDGKGTWEVIIENMKYFRDYVKSNVINIMIRINITKPIYDDRLRTLQYFSKEFSSDKRFHFFFHLAEDWGNANDKEIQKYFCGKEEFYKFIELASNLHLNMQVYNYFLRPGARVCFAAKENSYVITSEGGVRKCSLRLDEDNALIGNVKNDIPLKENPYQRNYEFERNEVCRECKKLPICFGSVCPSYPGKMEDTCGYDVSNVERLLKVIKRANDGMLEQISYLGGLGE